jgi:hypothetical protein
LEGDLELGADAIGGGDQHRFLVFCGVQGEEAAEAADVGQHLGAGGRLDQRTDQVDKAVAGFDVDPGSLKVDLLAKVNSFNKSPVAALSTPRGRAVQLSFNFTRQGP